MVTRARNAARVSLALAASSLLGASAPAQQEGPGAHPVLRVTGDATLAVQPDLASIQIGVVSAARTAERAAGENAAKLEATLAAIRGVLGPADEVKTLGYTLTPDYRYPKGGGQPKLVGYTATNVVGIRTGDLSRVGEVIDAATAAGADRLQGLQYTLRDEHPVRLKALREAARRAREKAGALASSLNLRIVRVLEVEEGAEPGAPRPLEARRVMAAEAAVARTPVEPGTLDVRATVTLTLEVRK